MKKLIHFLSASVAVMIFLGLSVVVVQADSCSLPDFASASFSNPLIIDNPYLPWVPGTTFIYEPVPNPDNVVNTVEVTSDVKTITVDGKSVDCRQVHDYVDVAGVRSEDTLDWYAQDDDGNVWYCGEDTTAYLPEGGIDKSGSFTAGEDVAHIGVIALPGIIMPGHPKSGECDQQEFYPGEAEDWGKVMRLNATVRLQNTLNPVNSYENCLETKEGSTIELGDIEQKFYAPGVGMVLNFEHHGKIVRWELISVAP
jgi:hypothetical protein